MLYPAIDKLLEKVDSRYTLVTMVSKRSRQLVEGREPLIKIDSEKPVTIAVGEVMADEITYTRPDNYLD